MKFSLPLVATFAALVTLTACGGGGSSGDTSAGTTVANPAAFAVTDTVVGTGAEAATGKTVAVSYTGWLYSATAADHKGTQFDASSSFTVTLGANQVISGFEQGVLGMKEGGKRTVYIPSSMGYGSTGYATIPGNAGLVFDITLIKVQ